MAAPKEGGFKMSLGGLKAKAGLKASPAQKPAKRPRLALDDDEPDDSNKQQEILGWDAAEGGALDASGKKEKEGPRIIPVQPNRDWRAEALRKQLAKAPHQQAQNGVDMDKVEEPKMQYGLTISKKEEPQETGAAESIAPEPMEDVNDNLTEEQRLEKKALDALLSGKSTDEDHVIPIMTEEEAFLNDIHNAPEAPTLAAYEATPIEGFGAALLRGMGWKDGESIGKNGALPVIKEVKRRPALLGIGAKEEAAVGIELGEWGPKAKGKGKKVAENYNPVTLRNKHTGEMITEEELKAKLESQDLIKDEKPEKSRSRYDDEAEEDDSRRGKRRGNRDDKDRDRDRRRDYGYDSERKDRDRKDDRRRDRDDYYDSDRKRDKRKDKDREDDYDSERRKDKRRERDRDDDYDSERRRDKRRDRDARHRSRSPNDKREKRRDRDRRDRSRSRDSDDRGKRRRDKDYSYDDDRDDRKRRYKEEKYYK
ncbi:Nn.00g098800.m01.CDS01 [Neocucurbitaria sp. VM-36]